MTDGWDGKEKRTTAPTAKLRRHYRWNRFLDSLAEERILLGVALIAVFVILGAIAAGVSAIHRDGEKTRALITCVVQSFAAPDRDAARGALVACIRDRD